MSTPFRLLLVAALALPALASADVGIAAQDSGVDVRLRGISAVDADIAWASGREGTVLRTVDGGRHWQAVIVSAEFAGLRPIQRHQRVYAALGARMHTDEVHALSMKTFTPQEWSSSQQ